MYVRAWVSVCDLGVTCGKMCVCPGCVANVERVCMCVRGCEFVTWVWHVEKRVCVCPGCVAKVERVCMCVGGCQFVTWV